MFLKMKLNIYKLFYFRFILFYLFSFFHIYLERIYTLHYVGTRHKKEIDK